MQLHQQHDLFIQAIHSTSKLSIRFFSEEDGTILTRKCAPMDHALGTRIKDGIPRYWVHDYDSDTKPHPLPLIPEKIVSMTLLEEKFDPADFMAWEPKWTVVRDWGRFS